MSKHINVNPDHYKVAGRERQGEDVDATKERRELANRVAKYPPPRKASPKRARARRKP